jgi:methylated-DNA-[protein]-cysteine S-methyltransferase
VETIEFTVSNHPMLTTLSDYLDGKCKQFDMPIDWRGMTDFQVKVRQAVMAIPAGETSTYGQIAVDIGKPGAARAVGRVNATNPIPLVIPCHRIVGADGSMTGYGGVGGVETKQWLLALEGN